jgi:hypothetical protein
MAKSSASSWGEGRWALCASASSGAVPGPARRKLTDKIRGLRADTLIDAIVISHHGGCGFTGQPLPRTRELAHAAIDAGADAVIGHHPHVLQGIEWYGDRPIFYSLGNLVMQLREGRPRRGVGALARVRLERGGRPAAWVCPFSIDGFKATPMQGSASAEAQARRFASQMAGLSRSWGELRIAEAAADGCLRVE